MVGLVHPWNAGEERLQTDLGNDRDEESVRAGSHAYGPGAREET